MPQPVHTLSETPAPPRHSRERTELSEPKKLENKLDQIRRQKIVE